MVRAVLLALVVMLPLLAAAQNANFQTEYQLHLAKTNAPITVDGILDEQAWSGAEVARDFWQKFPNDNIKAVRKTEVRAMYDDNYIYFGAVAYDTNQYIIQTLKRDYGWFDSDAFTVLIDPVNQRTNGFVFSVNAFNVQSEDVVSASTFSPLNFSWDNKWISATKRYQDHWIVEIAIPFKSIRYSADKTIWGINFLRTDTKNYAFSAWTHVPTNFPFYDLGYTGALIWDKLPPKAGSNISFIPYVSTSVTEDRENNETTQGKFSAGFDGKVALSSALNLDLTVNPDFSQVEVDQQVTNLTRYNIFFPERRTFFLENDDLFSSYGINPIRPFYSRTIGLDPNGNKIPIIGGVRLTGNLDKKTRIGIMNMQTLEKGDFAAQNYTAISINERVLSRSLIKAYFLNRQGFLNESQKTQQPLDAFGRNTGVEFQFTDKAGKWNGWGGYHLSFKPGISNNNQYFDVGGSYQTKRFSSMLDMGNVNTHYYTDMGYIERIENYDAKLDTSFRVGFKQIFNETEFRIYPEGGRLNQHRLGLETYIVFNPDGSFNERSNSLVYNMYFRNNSYLDMTVNNNEVDLKFNTSFTDAEPLPPGHYNYTLGRIHYFSDTRKKVYFSTGVTYGGFYNGRLLQYNGSVTFRAQPWGNFSVSVENDEIRFPSPYGSTSLFLVAPRIEINFSNSLFWTTFLQYNTQQNNFNINSRLQWRFKPMSDIYLVYTDNYFTDPLLKNKNRALVFKMNYWLNL